MNTVEITMQLDQALYELSKLRTLVMEGHYAHGDEASLAVRMCVIQNYLNNAWHYRRLSREQVEHFSDDSYEKMAFTVPRFDERLQLQSSLD